jgi:hypothetical protein
MRNDMGCSKLGQGYSWQSNSVKMCSTDLSPTLGATVACGIIEVLKISLSLAREQPGPEQPRRELLKIPLTGLMLCYEPGVA